MEAVKSGDYSACNYKTFKNMKEASLSEIFSSFPDIYLCLVHDCVFCKLWLFHDKIIRLIKSEHIGHS